jgi:hypothetical protein
MFKNRFILILAALSMLLVTLAVSQPFSKPPRPVGVPVIGAGDRPYVMDSATRSYIAWGEALEKVKLNALDSGTRSYIAWGEALEAADKLGDSGTCSDTPQENILDRIDSNLDSGTRSYIAWGLALQAKDDIGALCR